MENIQSLFNTTLTDLRMRAINLLVAFMPGRLGALSREMRALQLRVRLWLHAMVHELPEAWSAHAQRPPPDTRPNWYLDLKRAERARNRAARGPRAPSQPVEKFGLSLGFRAPSTRGASLIPRTSEPHDRVRDPPELRLCALIFEITDLHRTIADPSRAIAVLARRLKKRARTAPKPQNTYQETEFELLMLPDDDPCADQVTPQAAAPPPGT